MRRINSKYYEVWALGEVDEYGQFLPPQFTKKEVEANIAMNTQVVNKDNIQFIQSYYVGLTDCRDLEIGQELRNGNERFRILELNPYARRVQLVLEKVDE